MLGGGVTGEVKRECGDKDGQPWKDNQPPGVEEVGLAVAEILPQVACGGCTPNPKN